MMQKTKIEWADYTWNPVSGCSPVSAGCDHCYAARIAKRFDGTKGFLNGFQVTLHPDRLDEPRKLKGSGKRIFVCSMGDLFHPDVPDDFIESVFTVMRETPQHTFLVLTKRPERMVGKDWCVVSEKHSVDAEMVSNWYAPNIWVGVSAENQEAVDKRIPILVTLPVEHRFVSVEPMIEPVNLEKWLACQQTLEGCHARGLYPDYCGVDLNGCSRQNRIDWVICGAETGPKARHTETDWVSNLYDQCFAMGVPFFFKKWNDERDGGRDIRGLSNVGFVREWPEGI